MYPYLHPSLYISMYLSIYHLFIYLSIYLSIHHSLLFQIIHRVIFLSVNHYISLYICPSIHPYSYPSITISLSQTRSSLNHRSSLTLTQEALLLSHKKLSKSKLSYCQALAQKKLNVSQHSSHFNVQARAVLPLPSWESRPF